MRDETQLAPSATPDIIAPALSAPPAKRGGSGFVSWLALLISLGSAVAVGNVYVMNMKAEPTAPVTELLSVRQQVTDLEAIVDNLKNAPPSLPVAASAGEPKSDPAEANNAAPTIPAPVTTPTETVDKETINALTKDVTALRDRVATVEKNLGANAETQQTILQLKNDLAVANTAISGMYGNVQQVTNSAQQLAVRETATRGQMVAYIQFSTAATTALPFIAEWQRFCNATKAMPMIIKSCTDLEQAARSGVATPAMLQARFKVLSEAAEQAVAMSEAKTWWERVKVGFDSLIKIRKVDEDMTGSAGTARMLHEANAALQRGNLANAVMKVKALPTLAQDELREWLPDAEARLNLDSNLKMIADALAADNDKLPAANQPLTVPAVDTPVQNLPSTEPAAEPATEKAAQP